MFKDQQHIVAPSGIVPAFLTVEGWGDDGHPFRWTMCPDSFRFGSILNSPPFVTHRVRPSYVLTVCQAYKSRGLESRE